MFAEFFSTMLFTKSGRFRCMKFHRLIHYLVFGVAMTVMSCNKDDVSTDISVFTEEIVFTSGQSVILTGRVLAQGEIAVEDHGFQIDTNENFSNPIVISLGEKGIPGRFVGEVNALNIRLNYHCRAYIVIAGETKTGNVLNFSTQSPKALDFSPKEGIPNIKIVIEGQNFTSDTKVLWGDKVIVPEEIFAETFVEFSAPAFEGNPVVQLSLVSQGDTLMLNDPFEYIIGLWTDEGPMNDPDQNAHHIYFEDGEDFIYGIGLARGHMTSLVHVLKKNSLQNMAIVFPGTATEGAFFNETYFGGGSINKVTSPLMPLTNSNEFWKYENQGFVQLKNIPASLYKAVCLVSDDKVFVYGGETSTRLRNTVIYVYDINTDSWSVLSVAPISPLNSFPAFHLDGYNYFVAEDGTTYRHDYANDDWETVAKCPVAPAEYGISLLLNGQAYVGMQGTGKRINVYRPWNDTWRTKVSLPNLAQFLTIGGWTNNDKIYVMRTDLANFENRWLWSLDPDAF